MEVLRRAAVLVLALCVCNVCGRKGPQVSVFIPRKELRSDSHKNVRAKVIFLSQKGLKHSHP